MEREALTCGEVPRSRAHEAQAARAAGFLFPSGQMAIDFRGHLAQAARVPAAFPYYGSPIKRQTRLVLDNLRRLCEAAGTSLERIVKAQVFLRDLNDFFYFDEVWREYFPTPPPRTTIGTSALLVDNARVLVDVLALADATQEVEVVTSAAPRPLAHYREALRIGPLVFAAGQIASDYRTGIPPEARADPPLYQSAIKRQTAYVLGNLAKTFEAAGSSLDHVVKAQVFMRSMEDFAAFDEVWKEFFSTPPPRTTVGTTGLLVPETLVEIDLIGIARAGPYRREIIPVPEGVPRPMANYSVASRVGPFVFAAGQIASDYRTGIPLEARVPEPFPYYGIAVKRQAEYILANLDKTLRASGASLDRVVKAQVFLKDLDGFAALDEVWKRFFPDPPPRTVVATTGLLVPGTLVEIDLTAVGSEPG
ncbi:MAG: RidA family protein [Candidatus Methylomirabilia bacterium]